MTIKQIREFLTISIEKQHIANSYILYGGEEEVRDKTGIFFAQALNCVHTPDVCNNCAPCRAIEKGMYPDVKWIVPEKTLLSIDEVRMAKEEMYIKPYMDKHKIFFLKINWMRTEAANSLLKLLEEPPDYGIIFILSKTIHNFIPTITSRCIKLKINSVLKSYISEKDTTLINSIIQSRKKQDWKSFFLKISQIVKELEREEIEILMENIVLFLRDSFITTPASKELSEPDNHCIIKSTNIDVIEKIMAIKNKLRYNVNSKILLETVFTSI